MFKLFLTSLVTMTMLVVHPATALSGIGLEEATTNSFVQNFETHVSNLTQTERWVGNVTNYSPSGHLLSYGKYTYDTGTVRRFWYNSDSKAGFIMISDGEVSCERPVSTKFDDSLEADLKAEWLCVESGNPELVRFIFSLRPTGVMRVLDTASNKSVSFFLNSTTSTSVDKLTIMSSKAENVKPTKIVFTKKNKVITVKFFRNKKIAASSYITPAGDSDFVTKISDLRKKWK